MSKLYIVGLTQSGKLQDLKELLEPIQSFYNGLQWTFHTPLDEGYDYLNSMKKDGKIIPLDFCYRHDFSRDHYLFMGTMKTGDWFICMDDLERISPKFFEMWPNLRNLLESNGIDGCVLQGKRFLYRYSDQLRHSGNPHEGIQGCKKLIDLTQIDQFKDPKWFFWNVRNDKRDKFHYVFHHVKYYTNYPNSNHCLLGRDNNLKAFYEHDAARQEFRQYCETSDILPLNEERWIWLCKNKLDDIRKFVNYEKYLNDAYHYFINGREEYEKTRTETSMVIV